MRGRARTCSLVAAILAALVATAMAAVAPLGAAHAQERVSIAGTSVTLTPPPGFTVSRRSRGLEDAAGSTITVAERPAQAYAALAERFSSAKALSDGYAQQNVTIRSVRRIDGRIPFASGRQTTDGRDIAKYLALLEGDKTVLVTFNIADRGFTEADAEAVVRSIELTPGPTLEEQLATLPFTFRAVAPYALADLIPRQAVTLDVEGDDEQPVIVIGAGRSQAIMGDEPRVAAELLRATGREWRDAEIVAQGPAPFAGGEGYVVSAVAADRTSMQYLRIVPGGAYLRLLARGTTTAVENAKDVIEQIAATVEPQ